MRVGNGKVISLSVTVITVHPHACGERGKMRQKQGKFNGSSPCVWGTGENETKTGQIQRFIPMRVGNGEASETLFAAEAVHPHACGER